MEHKQVKRVNNKHTNTTQLSVTKKFIPLHQITDELTTSKLDAYIERKREVNGNIEKLMD